MPAPKSPTTPIRYSQGPCFGTSFESTQQKATAVNTDGDGQDNLYAFVTEPKDIIEDLFKGTEPEGGKAAEDCAAFGGSIIGIGPDCVKEKEEGEQDLAYCFYDKTYDCLTTYKNATEDAATAMAAQRLDSYAAASALTIVYMDAARQLQIDANLAYNDCIEEVKNKCECKDCAITIQKSPEEEADDDEEEPDPEPEVETPTTPRSITTIEKKTTALKSVYGPIPRVFGRYIVGGNLIWLGTKASESVERYRTGTQNTVFTLSDTATTCEFIVAICVGELDSLLRVWFNDLLVLSYVMDLNDPTSSTYTDLNLAILADDEHNTQEAYNKIVRMELYHGSGAQKVLQETAEFEGFGRTPAYRNIAYVHFKNVDLRLFGGSFPDIRFDVTSVPPQEVVNKLESESIADLYNTQIGMDPRLGTYILQRETDKLIVMDRDSMTVTKDVDFDFSNWATPTLNGRVIGIGGNAELLDPYLGDRDTRGLSRVPRQNDNGPYLRQIKYYHNLYPYELTVYAHSAASDGVAYIRHDSKVDDEVLLTSYFSDGTDSPDGFYTKAFEVASWGGSTYGYSFGMEDTGQFVIVRTALVVNGAIQEQLNNSVNYLKSPDTIWGTETDLTIYNCIFDGSDTSFILFCSVAGETRDFVFKIDARTNAVVWYTECPYALYYWNEAVPATTVFAEDYFYFISADSYLVRLTRADGTMANMGTLSSLSLPPYVSQSGQFYDALTKSIVYISDDGVSDPKVVRVFMERFSDPERVSLGTIIKSVMEQASLPPSTLDVSDVEDITIGGYLIQGKTSLRSILEEFAAFYRLSIVDDGTRIYIVKQSSLSSSITIDPDEDIAQQTLETRRVVPSSQIDTAIARYVGIGPDGLTEEIQTVSVAEQNDGDRLPRQKEFDVTVYDTGEYMRAYLEVALQAARADQDIFTARLMPKRLAITSNDRVTLNGRDFRVTGSTLGFDNQAEVSASLFFYDVVSENTNQSVVSINTNAYVKRKAKSEPYRPRVLFTNALTPTDAIRAMSVRQVAYSLIEADTPDIEDTRVSVYMHAHTGRVVRSERYGATGIDAAYKNIPRSPIYRGATHTKAAHSGVLQDAPEARTEGLYSCSKTDSLRVKFHRLDTIDVLKTFDPPCSVHETPNDNLLIVNGEYIQFADFEIDPSDASGTTVIFRKLYRGMYGTDTRTQEHYDGGGTAANELYPGLRVYLYTEDTIKPFGISAYYTKHQPVARVFINDQVPAGAAVLDVAHTADAGSARAWTPTHIKPYFYIYTDTNNTVGTTDDRIKLISYLSWKRREPMIVDHLENGGDLPNSYRANLWLMPRTTAEDVVITGSGSTDLYSGNILYGYNVSSVESRFRDWYAGKMQFTYAASGSGAYTGSIILRFNSLTPATPASATQYLTALGRPSRYTAVAGICSDETGDPTLGYPALVEVSQGWPYTYPTVIP